MVHVLVVVPADVSALVPEEPREAPQRVPPRRRESDDHLPTVVVRAARLAVIVSAWRANAATDFRAAAGSNGRGDDNDAEILAARAGGAKSLLEEANQIIGVVARAIFEDERGVSRSHETIG